MADLWVAMKVALKVDRMAEPKVPMSVVLWAAMMAAWLVELSEHSMVDWKVGWSVAPKAAPKVVM